MVMKSYLGKERHEKGLEGYEVIHDKAKNVKKMG
jgi:hypothetical protein